MAKVLRCRDVGMDCSWEGRAETTEALLGKAARHAAEVHKMTEIPDEKLAQVKSVIRDE